MLDMGLLLCASEQVGWCMEKGGDNGWVPKGLIKHKNLIILIYFL